MKAAAPLATAVGLGTCCVALALWNPGDGGTPLCPTKAVTGIDCPFCGGLRAVASLTRGRLDLAADHNVLVLALVPLAVAYWVAWVIAARRGLPAPRLRLPRGAWLSIAALAVVFTVVRNLPIDGVPRWLASRAS